MKKHSLKLKTIVAALLAMIMMTMPVCAATPRFTNISSAAITIDFDKNNVVYCGIVIEPYSTCAGISGLMKLYDSTGTCLEIWAVRDYEEPIAVENTYQGTYGETYTVEFAGYAYSNSATIAADRLELSITATCED